MRSQVQVLAGPPLFSQLRALPPPDQSHPLPARAAVGPHVLRAVQPKGPPGAGDPAPRAWSASCPAILPLTTCAQPVAGGRTSPRTPAPPTGDPRARPASPGRPDVEPGRCQPPPTITTRSSSTPPLAQDGLRQLPAPGSDSGRRRAGRGHRGATTPTPAVLAVWLPPHRPARGTHRVRTPWTRERTDTGRSHRTPGRPDVHTGHRTPVAWTSHGADTGRSHRTLDTRTRGRWPRTRTG
jgi:hypothetical protein